MTRLTQEQEAIRQKARELAAAVVAPRAAAVDRDEAYPWDNARALREAGFFGMTIPAAYGGPGLGFLEVCLVIEEMARVCGVTGRIAVEANMGAVSAIMAYGSEAQRDRFLLDLAVDGTTVEYRARGNGKAPASIAKTQLKELMEDVIALVPIAVVANVTARSSPMRPSALRVTAHGR